MSDLVAPEPIRPVQQQALALVQGVAPNDPWDLVLNRKWEWHYDARQKAGYWLPDVQKVSRRIGVNGNKVGAETRNLEHAVRKLRCIHVDPWDGRLADEFKGFIGATKVGVGNQQTGVYHSLKWTRFESVEGGRRHEAVPDRAMTHRFRAHLADKFGLAIDQTALRDLVSRLDSRISRILDRVNDGDLARADAEQTIAAIEAEKDAAQDAWESLRAGEPIELLEPESAADAKPKGRIRRSKKPEAS